MEQPKKKKILNEYVWIDEVSQYVADIDIYIFFYFWICILFLFLLWISSSIRHETIFARLFLHTFFCFEKMKRKICKNKNEWPSCWYKNKKLKNQNEKSLVITDQAIYNRKGTKSSRKTRLETFFFLFWYLLCRNVINLLFFFSNIFEWMK